MINGKSFEFSRKIVKPKAIRNILQLFKNENVKDALEFHTTSIKFKKSHF